jgi:hypothetical protein
MGKYDLTEAEDALLERAGYYAAQDDILGNVTILEDEDEDEDDDIWLEDDEDEDEAPF